MLVTAERTGRPCLDHSSTGQMPMKTLFTTLVLSVTFGDLLQRVPHQHLVVRSGKDGGRDVDQSGDPGIVFVCEDVSAVKDQGDETGPQVPGQVGRDWDIGVTPDHSGVGHTDDERDAGGRNEGIAWIKTRPDDKALAICQHTRPPRIQSSCTYDVAVDEPLDEEKVSKVVLLRVGEGT